MQQQVHAAGAVRHAEKRRRGTCAFANRIARVALDAYDRVVPASYREANRRTCVAAVVACIRDAGRDEERPVGDADSGSGVEEGSGLGKAADSDSGSNTRLQVMGLGAGTKFLPDATLREERQSDEYGKRIRDCHAEVLARRAFRRQLALEMRDHYLRPERKNAGKKCQGGEVRYIPILERVNGSDDAGGVRFRLRPDVTLHFYASSAPCGNATLKKFVKMQKEKFDASLGPDEWPKQPHTPIAAHSLRLGQFSLLVKKDGSIPQDTPNEDANASEVDASGTEQRGDHPRQKRKRGKPWPCREDDAWCPPSCSIVDFGEGTLHSCSDKLCRWNCLGLQGALLAPLLEEPLYMTTLTVGRKFSREICRRAVCCRADGFGSMAQWKGSESNENGESLGRYRLNHPVLMETNVYMDDAGTHDMAGVKSIGQDATFDSNLCWVWWPDSAAADCLDGKTGLTINFHDTAGSAIPESETHEFSDCSTFAMFQLSLGILQRSDVSHADAGIGSTVTLSGVRQFKLQVSAPYEKAKAELLCHRVFDQWNCRIADESTSVKTSMK